MKGVDGCEKCGDRLPVQRDTITIKEGETVFKVETNPKSRKHCIKKTKLYHPECFEELLKEELREEYKKELKEEAKEELKEELKEEIEEGTKTLAEL